MLEFLLQQGDQVFVDPKAGESKVHPFALEVSFVWVAFRWLNLAEELNGAACGQFTLSVGKEEACDTVISR